MQNLFGPLLAVLFIGLKLTGYIAWPWLWVLAPLWAGVAVVLAIVVVVFLLGCAGLVPVKSVRL